MPVRRSPDHQRDVDLYIASARSILTSFVTIYERYQPLVKAVHTQSDGWHSHLSILNALCQTGGGVAAAAAALRATPPPPRLDFLLARNNAEIPTADVVSAADHACRGLTTTCPAHFFETNRDILFARKMLANIEAEVETFFTCCKMYNGAMRVLPEQMLVAMYNTYIEEERIDASFSWPAETNGERVNRMFVQPGVRMRIKIMTSSPGSGKTLIAGITAMQLLNNDALLEKHKRAHERRGVGTDYGGFSEQPYCDVAESIARVVLLVVPVAVKAQTKATIEKVVEGTNTEMWCDIGGRDIGDAHRSGKKIVWICPQNQSLTAMLRRTPKIGHIASIFDECNSSVAKNGCKEQSEPLFYLIAQATPDKLNDAICNKPSHPLRRALDASGLCNTLNRYTSPYYRYSVRPSVFARQNLMFLPEFLRTGLNTAAAARMPPGFVVYNLRTKAVNLRTALTGARVDHLAPTSIAAFLHELLAPNERHLASISKPQFAALLERIDGEGDAVSPETISDVLQRAHDLIPNPESLSHVTSAKAAILRLREKLEEVFAGDRDESRCVDCPIMLTPLLRKDAVVLSCCMNIISKEANESLLTSVCPMCRFKRTRSVVFGGGAGPSGEGEEGDEFREFRADPSESFGEAVDRITGLNRPPISAISHLLLTTLSKRPSARILLMTQRGERGECSASLLRGIAAVTRTVKRHFPRVEFVDSSGRKKVNVARFNDVLGFPNPIVVLTDISSGSNTAQGLDLYSTDVTIMAGDARTDIKLQTLFRGCRMRSDAQRDPKLIVSFI